MYIQLVWTMCSICVSTMSSRCLLYRAPNPNSQSIFSCGSYLMLFVCCYTFIICQSILFVNTFFKFFLFFFTLSHQWDFLLVLNLYTFIICQSILFVNTFLKFFLFFFTLSYQWDFLLVLNFYTFIIFSLYFFVNTFLNFFIFFCLSVLYCLYFYYIQPLLFCQYFFKNFLNFFLPLATQGNFTRCITFILLLYSAFTFLSILF